MRFSRHCPAHVRLGTNVRYRPLLLASLVLSLLTTGPARSEVEKPSPGPEKSAATQPADGSSSSFRCDEPVHDFGKVWGNTKLDHAFIVHNEGSAPLEILNVKPGCGCTKNGDYDKVIAPGKQGRIPLSLKTSRGGSRPEYPKTVNITVTTNDPKHKTVKLTLKVVVRKRFTLEPASAFVWGKFNPKMALTRKAKVTNQTDRPMKLELPPSVKQAPFELAVKEIEPGKVAELTVTLHPPFKEGINRATYKLKTGIEQEPELSILCNLTQPPLVELRPKTLMVRTVPARLSNLPITIRYNGEGMMKILSVQASDPSIKTAVKELTAAPGKSFEVTVTLPEGWSIPPDKPEKVVIKTDLASKPEIIVPIRMTPPRLTPAQRLVGKPAPNATVKSPEGREIKIGAAHVMNQVTVLNFWAAYCPHCKLQLPVMQRLYAQYGSRGVRFLNISTDKLKPAADVVDASKQMGVSIPIGLDPKGQAARPYGNPGLPTVFLIGKNGVVEAVHKGAGGRIASQLAGREREIAAQLDLLLAGKTRKAFAKTPAGSGRQYSTAAAASSAVVHQGPHLTVDSLRQDVGQHKPGDKFAYKLYMLNDGTEPLKFSSIEPLGEIKIDPDYPKELAPKAAGVLKCELTAPTRVGPFVYRVQIESNDKVRPKSTITLTGTVRPYLQIDPPTGVDFGRKTITHTMPRMATILYNGPGTIKYLSAESSSPSFETQIEVMGKGPHGMLTVTGKPPFKTGFNRAYITVRTDCKEQPVVRVPVRLYQPPRVEVVPRATRFQIHRRLETQRRTITITGHGDKPLKILGVESSNPSIGTELRPGPDGQSYTLELTVKPNSNLVRKNETVTIRTNDPEFKEIVVQVRVH